MSIDPHAMITNVGVFMGDHAQDVVKPIDLPRWMTVGDIIDKYLTETGFRVNDEVSKAKDDCYITIRAVDVPDDAYDVSAEAFEKACEAHAPYETDSVGRWPDGYDDRAVEHVRDTVGIIFRSAGLTVEPSAQKPPEPKPNDGEVPW